MEAAAAGEGEGRLDAGAAGLAHAPLGVVDVDREEDDEHATARDGAARREATREAAVLEARVVGAVVGELPAERLLVESFRRLNVGRRELDVVDAAVVLGADLGCLVGSGSVAHGSLLKGDARTLGRLAALVLNE